MHPTHLDTAFPERANLTDRTSETFGLLRVERYAGRRDTSYYWECRCRCGARTTNVPTAFCRHTCRPSRNRFSDAPEKRLTSVSAEQVVWALQRERALQGILALFKG